MEDNFQLRMLPMGKSTIKFNVEVYYRSNVVLRFRLKGGDKVMELEKRLLQKQNSWKILSINFELEKVDETTTRNLFELFHMLDEQITGTSRVTYRNPLERRSGK